MQASSIAFEEQCFSFFETTLLPTISGLGDGEILGSGVLVSGIFNGTSKEIFSMTLRHVVRGTRPELLESFKKKFLHPMCTHTKLPEETPEESMFRMISTKGSPELAGAVRGALAADSDSIICGSSVLEMVRSPGVERVFGDVDIFVKVDAPGIKEIAHILLSQDKKNIIPGMYSKDVSPVNILLLIEAVVGSLAIQLVIMVEKPKDVIAGADLSCCRMFIDKDGLGSSVPEDIPMARNDEMLFTGSYPLDKSRQGRQMKYKMRGMKLIENPAMSGTLARVDPVPDMRNHIILCLWKTLRL